MSTFKGDKKVGSSILTTVEKRFVKKYISIIPPQVETYHLTMCTIVWSLGMVYCGHLAKGNIAWIWGCTLMLCLQYLTDLFDGAIGRHRNTGLIKWGFYMDHFLDFIFSGAIVIAYALMSPPNLEIYFFALLVCSGAFLVNSFLCFASTNEFEIYHYGLGPTEIRIGFAIMNLIICIFSTSIFKFWLPIILTANVIALVVMVFSSHKKLWKIDMYKKRKSAWEKRRQENSQ